MTKEYRDPKDTKPIIEAMKRVGADPKDPAALRRFFPGDPEAGKPRGSSWMDENYGPLPVLETNEPG